MSISRNAALLIGATAALGSAVTVVRRRALLSIDPWHYETIAGLVHVSFIPLFLLLMGPERVLQGWSSGSWWAALGALLNVGCTLAFLWSLRGAGNVGVVSTLASLSPVLTIMLGALFLNEVPSWRQAVGVAFILLGSVVAASG